MKKYTAEELKEALELHKQWLNATGGTCADLCGAYLRGAYLCGANLRNANLCNADLCNANLRGADLCNANLRDANLRGADLCGANLCDADLCGADLRGADLCGADLCGVFGNIAHIKSLQTEKYNVTYTADVIQIGCQRHTIEKWKKFDDETIKRMDSGALEWWKKWKPILMHIIEMSPCEPTKGE